MANARYDRYAERLLDPNVTGHAAAATDWNTDDIRATLHSSTYTFSQTHQDFADLSGQIDSQEDTLASVVVSNDNDGTVDVDSADLSFTAVAGGSTIDSYIYRKYNATATLSELMLYFDTDSGGPISLLTNGADVNVVQPAGGILTI